MKQNPTQLATAGEAYEPLTGRWSRLVAPRFLESIDASANGRWLDVGCGTGALIQAILDVESPREVVGVDPSSAYIAYARRQIADQRVRYEVGDARSLPVASNQYDAVVSGLVINVLPPADQPNAVREMTRAARRGGMVASYVWDYAGGMGLRARFWEAAIALDPAAAAQDERTRYPICASISSSGCSAPPTFTRSNRMQSRSRRLPGFRRLLAAVFGWLRSGQRLSPGIADPRAGTPAGTVARRARSRSRRSIQFADSGAERARNQVTRRATLPECQPIAICVPDVKRFPRTNGAKSGLYW